MKHLNLTRRAPALLAIALLASAGVIGSAYAALQGNDNAKKGKVLIGADNDVNTDPTIQPIPTPPGPNQSLNKSDQLVGGKGPDMIIGRLGPDVILGGPEDDVMIGGTEGGQPPAPAPQFPNNDIAFGGSGSDTFIWAPGDGSDAFIGGNPAKGERKGKKGKKTATVSAPKKGKKKKKEEEADTLVIGNLVLTSDSTLPELFRNKKFGELPRVFSSDRGVPTPLGGTPPRNPNLTGLCEIVQAPAGLGYDFLVRFFGSPGNLAVTIRVKGVEQVICPTAGTDGATLTTLGKKGSGSPKVESTDFTAKKKSKLAAFVF